MKIGHFKLFSSNTKDNNKVCKLFTLYAANQQHTFSTSTKPSRYDYLTNFSKLSCPSLFVFPSSSCSFPRSVKLVEMSPRDGLQNEKMIISLENKIKLINDLSDTGLTSIEVGSFVSPKWVPQMANSDEILQKINKKSHISYPVLTPNLKGLENAIKFGAKEIAIFTAASETFNQTNINCSIKQSLINYEKVIQLAKQHSISVRGYISCVVGCPYEGLIDPKQVSNIAKQLYEMGCYEISLGDTIGIGNVFTTSNMLNEVIKQIPLENIAVHFHDTYGQALANILISLQNGINVIDCSISGLGGCPYAKGATGNVATEDVLFLLNGLGIETGVELNKIVEISEWISTILQRDITSRSGKAFANFVK